jgi:hypothetical protein
MVLPLDSRPSRDYILPDLFPPPLLWLVRGGASLPDALPLLSCGRADPASFPAIPHPPTPVWVRTALARGPEGEVVPAQAHR